MVRAGVGLLIRVGVAGAAHAGPFPTGALDKPDKLRADPHALNTLGSIEAELGDLGVAKDDLWRAIDQQRGVVPTDSDWYSIGRYAEKVGLASDAIAIYRRIRPTPGADGIDRSPFELAAVRLRALGVKP